MEYEKIDAWKACDALVKAVFDATKEIESRDPELLGHICRNSLRAAVKLAYGCGTQNRKMLVMSVQRSAGYLSAFAYNISLARVMGVLSEDVCTRLEALRGRASFYTWQLFETLLTPPAGESAGGEIP